VRKQKLSTNLKISRQDWASIELQCNEAVSAIVLSIADTALKNPVFSGVNRHAMITAVSGAIAKAAMTSRLSSYLASTVEVQE
jgi:hypothetical protein